MKLLTIQYINKKFSLIKSPSGKVFKVLTCEDYGGLKTHGLNYLKNFSKTNSQINHLVYIGPTTALGMLAIAIKGVEYGYKVTIYAVGSESYSSREVAKLENATIYVINKYNIKNMNKIHKGFSSHCQIDGNIKLGYIEDYLKEKNIAPNEYTKVIGFGANEDAFVESLKEYLMKKLSNFDGIDTQKDYNIFMACGSGVTLSVLLEVFPNASFHLVQVGVDVKKSLDYMIHELNRIKEVELNRIKIHKSTLRFPEPAKCKSPYSTLSNYDGKVLDILSELFEEENEVVLDLDKLLVFNIGGTVC